MKSLQGGRDGEREGKVCGSHCSCPFLGAKCDKSNSNILGGVGGAFEQDCKRI